MNTDAKLFFDEAAAHLTTAVSTNTVDLSTVRDIGIGGKLFVVAIVTTAMTDGSSDSTMQLDLVDDDNEGLASPATLQNICTFPATSAVGTTYYTTIDPGKMTQQYLGVKYTVANGDLTTGSFTVYITPSIEFAQRQVSGFSIG